MAPALSVVITVYYSYYCHDGGSVVLCALVLLTSRIGRFPSSRVCAAEDGCSHLKCLRHDSIMARGSAHTKHAVQRHTPTLPCRPDRPRATTPTSSLTLFISTTDAGHANLCRSRLRLLLPTALVPAPPFNNNACLFHKPGPPGLCSKACMLATSSPSAVSLLCLSAQPLPGWTLYRRTI